MELVARSMPHRTVDTVDGGQTVFITLPRGLWDRKASYLKLAFSQFQAGRVRVALMMPRILQSWTEEDFNNVVTYISGMRLMGGLRLKILIIFPEELKDAVMLWTRWA